MTSQSAPEPIKTYSLEEVAAMVLPQDLKNPVLWLKRRLTSGGASGYKIGRTWRMTHEDVVDLITRHRNAPRVPERPTPEPGEHPYGGLTRRSWLHHHRNPRERHYSRPEDRVEFPDKTPLPSGFKIVTAEPPDAIAGMRPLTKPQQALLERVREEGEVEYSDRNCRPTVEALAKRGLITYEAERVLNPKYHQYFIRFTIRPLTRSRVRLTAGRQGSADCQ
ncbi:MAG: hypothetical protein PGN37_13490 [Mycobacterium kyogaense]|uniref:hypothetical protein n=1 Tax=Mycobacterium kyogaense TaxID=2212479 RepID=UPI002FF546C1